MYSVAVEDHQHVDEVKIYLRLLYDLLELDDENFNIA